MSRILDPENPFIIVLGRIADMVILNILTILLCIPVITSGAALTADYYCALKIKRGEDSGIVKLYFKSFRENFRQAVILTLIVIVVLVLPVMTMYAVGRGYGNDTESAAQTTTETSENIQTDAETVSQISLPTGTSALLAAFVLLAGFVVIMIFPVLSRFSNTIPGIIKTALILSFSNPLRTLTILVVTAAPFYLTWMFPVAIPALALFGISVPAFVSVMLYNKAFLKIEDETNKAAGKAEAGSEDEHIFSDPDDRDEHIFAGTDGRDEHIFADSDSDDEKE